MKKQTITSDDVMKALGETLKGIRISKKMSQEELAFNLGYSSSGTISNIEKGKAFVSAKNIASICNVFQIQLRELFDNEGLLKFFDNEPINRDTVSILTKINNKEYLLMINHLVRTLYENKD